MIQCKNLQTKKMHQNAAEQENGTPPASEHHDLTVVSTMGRGGCHRPGALFFSLVASISYDPLFPTRLFFGLCCVFPFKRSMYLAYLG